MSLTWYAHFEIVADCGAVQVPDPGHGRHSKCHVLPTTIGTGDRSAYLRVTPIRSNSASSAGKAMALVCTASRRSPRNFDPHDPPVCSAFTTVQGVPHGEASEGLLPQVYTGTLRQQLDDGRGVFLSPALFHSGLRRFGGYGERRQLHPG